jgi:hypothetical protein
MADGAAGPAITVFSTGHAMPARIAEAATGGEYR